MIIIQYKTSKQHYFLIAFKCHCLTVCGSHCVYSYPNEVLNAAEFNCMTEQKAHGIAKFLTLIDILSGLF